MKTGDFIKTHIPTETDVVANIQFNTNVGKVVFQITENPSKVDMFSYLIVLFDPIDYKSVEYAIDVCTKNMDKKIVLCANKCDYYTRFHKNLPKSINKVYTCLKLREENSNIIMFITSYKSNYNFEKPFLKVLQYATTPNTHFIDELDTSPLASLAPLNTA